MTIRKHAVEPVSELPRNRDLFADHAMWLVEYSKAGSRQNQHEDLEIMRLANHPELIHHVLHRHGVWSLGNSVAVDGRPCIATVLMDWQGLRGQRASDVKQPEGVTTMDLLSRRFDALEGPSLRPEAFHPSKRDEDEAIFVAAGCSGDDGPLYSATKSSSAAFWSRRRVPMPVIAGQVFLFVTALVLIAGSL